MKTYEIVIVCNEAYAQHATVMLCSLFEKNKALRFRIHLLTDGLSEESRTLMTEFCRLYDNELNILMPEFSDSGIDLSLLPTGQWNKMMYYKLYIPRLLPEDTGKCLFLDVDMVINDSIAPLYDQDLDDCVIAAAEDVPDCVTIKKRIGLPEDAAYINSGVMMCNLNKWREMEKARPIFGFVNEVKSRIVNEQDVLALYFQGNIRFLPIRWNMTTFYFNRRPYIFSKYLPELREAQLHPAIIHFAAPIKPWYRDSQHPYRHLYRKYRNLTPWCDEPIQGYYEQLSPIKRVKKTIRNFLNYHNIMHDSGYQTL